MGVRRSGRVGHCPLLRVAFWAGARAQLAPMRFRSPWHRHRERKRSDLERDDIGLNRLGFPNRAYSDSPCWLGRRPVWMGKPYSMDFGARAVAAVLKEGLSRHGSAARFGVAPSTVINWMRRFRGTGGGAPGQMGGA